MPYLPPMARIRSRLVPEGDCMAYTGPLSRAGYGQLSVDGKLQYAHRLWWLGHGREIPPGYELDHLCRNTSCVRLDHLEAVTHGDNIRRGKAAIKTWCKYGHEYTDENTCRKYGSRACIRCRQIRYQQRNLARRLARDRS